MPENIAESLVAAAARSRLLLEDEACERIARFILSRQRDDGGFAGNDSRSDLYYTLFAFQSLKALDVTALPRPVGGFLSRFNERTDLDLVHTVCLAQSLAMSESAGGAGCAANVVGRLGSFRATGGGYALLPGQEKGTIYGDYLVMLAGGLTRGAEDQQIVDHIMSLRTPDGGFANEEGLARGTTTATAAALIMLNGLGAAPDERGVNWLRAGWRSDGGFAATPRAPVADLLSTATALHALSSVSSLDADLRKRAVEFVENHWGDDGGFFGTTAEGRSDCEYTFYGLLALGSLTGGPNAR